MVSIVPLCKQMDKIVGVFEDYKQSKNSCSHLLLADLMLAGISRTDISIISYDDKKSLFSGKDDNIGQPDSETVKDSDFIHSKIYRKDDSRYPLVVMKGSLVGALIGLILNYTILLLVPGIGDMLLAESLSVFLASGLNGLILGFVFGGVINFLRFESDKIKLITIVYTSNSEEIREIFIKYNASKINIYHGHQ